MTAIRSGAQLSLFIPIVLVVSFLCQGQDQSGCSSDSCSREAERARYYGALCHVMVTYNLCPYMYIMIGVWSRFEVLWLHGRYPYGCYRVICNSV